MADDKNAGAQKRFVLNNATREIHDRQRARGDCNLDQIVDFTESDDFGQLRDFGGDLCGHCCASER